MKIIFVSFWTILKSAAPSNGEVLEYLEKEIRALSANNIKPHVNDGYESDSEERDLLQKKSDGDVE